MTKNNKERVFGRTEMHKHEKSRAKKEHSPSIPIFLGVSLVAVVCFVLLFAGVGVASAATYYASPGGGGDGSSSSKPFQIADFWPKAKPGDTLILLDGTYTGSRSMIDPTNGLSGTNGSPITIKALNDGKVTIDGQKGRLPIWLNRNNWFIIEGLNAGRSAKAGHPYGSGATVFMERSNHNIFRRVCAWDAPSDNSNIFTLSSWSSYNLIEDCAVWGIGRKSVLTTTDSNYNVFRRFFGVVQGEFERCCPNGINSPYQGTGNIIENCILTVDMLPGSTGGGNRKLFGSATESTLDYKQATHYYYGCIGYRKAGQRGYFKQMLTPLGSSGLNNNVPVRGFKQFIVKDMVIYNELSNEGVGWYGLYAPYLKSGKFFYKDFQLKNITMIGRRAPSGGSSHINFYTTSGDSRYHSIKNSIAIGADVGVQSSGGISDYIWAYNNAQNFKGGIPKHYRTDALDLTANGGNILQYGLSEEERPKVNGQSVGAQIQYRYVNGKLTNEPLWPWPMNQRIIDAMRQSGYTPIDVTRTVFELGGGTMPDFGPRYDVNEDGKVDILDIIIVGQHFGETTNPPYPRYDVNEDGKVDILDIIIVGQHFGEITR